MNSSPPPRGCAQMHTRWPLGMPTVPAGAHRFMQDPLQDQYTRQWETVAPTYGNVYPYARPHANLHYPGTSSATSSHQWPPLTHFPETHFQPSPGTPPAQYYRQPQINHYATVLAHNSLGNVHYEPVGYAGHAPYQIPQQYAYPLWHHAVPRIIELPRTGSVHKPEHVQIPETYPVPGTLSNSVQSPQALPGVESRSAASQSVVPRDNLILKIPPKRLTQEPEPECIREAKRPRVEDDSGPSCPGADIDGMQEAVRNGVVEPSAAGPAIYPEILHPVPLPPGGTSGDSLNHNHQPLSNSRDECKTQADDAQKGLSAASYATASSPKGMTQALQRPTPPPPPPPPPQRDSARPSTPSNTHQFPSGLYGREQPKRAATRKYQFAVTPPRPRRVSKTLSQLDQGADTPHVDETPDVEAAKPKPTRRKRPVAEYQPRASMRRRHIPSHEQNSIGSETPSLTRSQTARERSLQKLTERLKVPGDDATSAPPPHAHHHTKAPTRDEDGDEQFVQAVIQSCEEAIAKSKVETVYAVSAKRIADLLRRATFASPEEAKFLTKAEAEVETSANEFFDGPIITEGQQTLPLQTIDQFLGEYYEPDAKIHIQDSSVKVGKTYIAVRPVRVDQVRERLAATTKRLPWNCLELATHHSDGLRPSFLQNEDCRLLTKLKIPDSADEARRKTYEQGYKEIESWALLAQAGALTEPHQDSHGYSTFITINQGKVGFGWLSNPSEGEREGWRRNPQGFTGGRWRYVVLKPGQTVYFPAGTVHMVFRLPEAGHTLAFGGHVLRCSNIVHWVKTLVEERNHPNVTNEDLLDSSHGYLTRVERFVKRALDNGTAEKWGGQQSIEEFLALKKEFFRRKQKQSRH